MIVQKLNNVSIDSPFNLAYRYFQILSVVNDFEYRGKPMELVKRDIQLLAYAITENKDVSEIKVEFVEKFNTSMATVGNIISKLYKLNILIKERRVVRIHPTLILDFTKDLGLGITLRHGNQG